MNKNHKDRKEKLLENLFNETYCRLAPSKIHGIGVVAIKDIPKNTDPFKLSAGKCIKYNLIDVSENEIKKLDGGIKKIITDFISPVIENNEKIYSIPENGFNGMDISFYLNHSDKNNIGLKHDTGCEFFSFHTLRKIKKGEELTIDYKDYEDK
jgi:SET domain-containing protein